MPPCGGARLSNTHGILPPRAWRDWRLNGLGATRHFHQGLLVPELFYWIDRLTVDAKLEVERRCPSRGAPDRAERHVALDVERGQVAVEGIGLGAVVDDDQVAESGERVGIGDLAFVHRYDGGALVRRDFDAVALGCGAKAGLLPALEGRGDVARNRWREIAAKRSEWQGERGRRHGASAAGRHRRERGLELLVGELQLTCELRREIA